MATDNPEPLTETEKAFLANPELVAALDRAEQQIADGHVVTRTRRPRPAAQRQD